MEKQIKGLRKLSTEEMENVKGGITCMEFLDICFDLMMDDRPNYQAQGRLIFDLYLSQYCPD